MDIILIRHGEREHSLPSQNEKDEPLTQEGKHKVDCLKDLLARQKLSPDIFFTSKWEHAKQTAERLSDGRPVYPIDALTPTPHRSTNITKANICDALIAEAKQVGVDLSALSQQTKAPIVAIVGHVPRLNYILECLTSSTTEPSLNRAEAIRVSADLLHGKGKIQGRIYCPEVSVVDDDKI